MKKLIIIAMFPILFAVKRSVVAGYPVPCAVHEVKVMYNKDYFTKKYVKDSKDYLWKQPSDKVFIE